MLSLDWNMEGADPESLSWQPTHLLPIPHAIFTPKPGKQCIKLHRQLLCANAERKTCKKYTTNQNAEWKIKYQIPNQWERHIVVYVTSAKQIQLKQRQIQISLILLNQGFGWTSRLSSPTGRESFHVPVRNLLPPTCYQYPTRFYSNVSNYTGNHYARISNNSDNHCTQNLQPMRTPHVISAKKYN